MLQIINNPLLTTLNLEKILFITQIILNLSISMITMSHIRIHKDQLFIPIP